MFVLVNALAIGGFSGFIFGQFAGIRTARLNSWKLSPLQHLRLSLFFGLIYFCLGILFGLGLGLAGWLVSRFFAVSVKALTGFYILFCSILLSYFIFKWTKLRRESLRVCISIVKGFVVFFVFSKVSLWYEAFFPASLFVYFSLFTPLAWIFMIESIKQKNRQKTPASKAGSAGPPPAPVNAKVHDTKTKILLIGLDAADWQAMEPLIEEGRLPHLARMRNEGFYAQASTLVPTSSPSIWTSIASSKTPQEHGIIDWQKTVFPGLGPLPGEPSSLRYPKGCGARTMINWLLKRTIVKVAPSTSQSRGCKAFWNVLSDFGKRSATIGWLFSWPAEIVKGISVSWYTYPFEEAANVLQRFSSRGLKRRTYPEGFIKDIEPLIVSQKDLTKEELKRLNIPTIDIDHDKVRFADQISPWYLAKDKTFFKIASFILDTYNDLDVVSVFLSGIDATAHTYWTFVNKEAQFQRLRDQILSISDDPGFKDESKGFADCIDLYYQYMDTLIGKLLEKTGQDWTTVVISDHGFRYDGTGHSQGCEGACILYGKNIRKSGGGHTVSIYDIAPTILALSGVPLAGDLEGRVIKEAIDDDFFKEYPLGRVNTYESPAEQKEEMIDTPSDVEEGLTRRLRALGYID
ncbi:alkaline phosphatase family protein [Candidatus Omnitrophota bacterium]